MRKIIGISFLFISVFNVAFMSAQANSIVYEQIQKEFSKKRSINTIHNLLYSTPKRSANMLDAGIDNYKILNLNKELALSIIEEHPRTISIELKDSDNEEITLDLMTSSDIFSDMIIETESGKLYSSDDVKGVFYKGIIRGDKESLVTLNIFENEISGVIANPKGNLVLGKMKENEDHIIYNARAIKNKDPFACSVSETALTEEEEEVINNFNPGSNKNEIIEYAVGLYYETEYDMFQTKRSVLNVAQYVMELHNQVSIMYLNEGIKTPLSKIKIWDVEDPYKSGNTRGLLNEFTNHMGKLEGDLGILLTFRSIGGGRASGFYGLSCPGEPFENDIANKIAVAGIYDYFRPVPNYSWSVYVITHEFGHLFGSRHTHNCSWNGGAIDGCEAVEGRCKRPLMTREKGTIMSYCHLSQNGAPGIDFSKGFGLQPGNLIRYNVKRARIKCLGTSTECEQDLKLKNTLSGYISHKVKNKISSSSTIDNNSVVNLKGKQIILTNGFSSSGYDNSIFKASVEPCEQFSYNEKGEVNNIRNEEIEDIKVEISPNPSSGIFRVAFNKAFEGIIKVINIEGKTIYSETFKGREFDINISNKPNGIYIINIKSGSKSVSEKIIKN